MLKNAKSLQRSDFSEVFVSKLLTEEQREVEKDLRTKFKRLNDHNKPLINGKQLYVVANGRLHSRDADGRINYKKSLDVDRLISEIDAASKGSDYFCNVVFWTQEAWITSWQNYRIFWTLSHCLSRS